MDRSGDFVYQMFDIISLLLVLFLLYCTHKKSRGWWSKPDTPKKDFSKSV